MPGFTCINSYNPQSHLPRRQELLSPVFYRWGNWGSKGLSKWPEDTKLTSSKAWIWTQTIWVKSHTACTAVYTGCVHWICNVYTGWNCKDPPLGLFMIGRGGRKKNINCDIPIQKYYATMKNDAIEKKKDLCKDRKYKIGCLLERQPTMWLWSETKGRLVFLSPTPFFTS